LRGRPGRSRGGRDRRPGCRAGRCRRRRRRCRDRGRGRGAEVTPAAQEEPVSRDKRKLGPVTGELRGGAAETGGATAPEAPDTGSDQAGADAAAQEPDELAAAKAEALDLADQLARAKADLYNLDQRFNNYVQRSKADVA